MGNPVLLIDDDLEFTNTLGKRLGQKGLEIISAATAQEGIQKLTNQSVDLVLLDIGLPDKSGIDVVKDIKGLSPEVPVIMVSASGETHHIVAAMQNGASDYVQKPFEHLELLKKVQNLLSMRRIKNTEKELDSDSELSNHIIGKSPQTKQLLRSVSQIANLDATVLLRGESGTGKTMVAEVIHRHSARRDQPLVVINCAAIPENLLESELFGHVKGAFTGAVRDKIGKFGQANRGTIFLDEIGDLSPELQVKILRVLQGREFEKVGGLDTIRVDVRVIAATNRNLEEAMLSGVFREDLFYRLNVLPIMVPSLRDRQEDISLLVNHFIEIFSCKSNKHFEPLSDAIMEHLMNYGWPGNIRELQNVVERAVILAKEPKFEIADFVINSHQNNDPNHSNSELNAMVVEDFTSLKDLEHKMLVKALKQCGGNISRVARSLGIGRDTVYRRMKKYNIGLRQ